MAANNIIALTQENFATEVLQSSTPVLVDFWAQWCNPCRALTPILDELADEYDGRVKIGKVNTDDQQSLAVQYSITAIVAQIRVFFSALARVGDLSRFGYQWH